MMARRNEHPSAALPNCRGTDIVRHETTRQGKQRYRCREKRCLVFLLKTFAKMAPDKTGLTGD
jgi:hypothetical protein